MDPNRWSRVAPVAIAPDDTLIAGLRKMDAVGRKLLVVADGCAFRGLLSVGDVQRAILKGVDLSERVDSALRAAITTARDGESEDTLRARMLVHRTEFMPVLDDAGELVDVVFWEDLFPGSTSAPSRALGLPVVIMAGGVGSRLRPLTSIIPKALVPLGDKPIVQLIMERFADAGCAEFYVSVNYKSEMIQFYLDGVDLGSSRVEYFRESFPLGTAGSLSLLRDRLTTPFFVNNCDILIDQDYGAIYDYHVEHGDVLTMVAAIKTYKIPYGTLDVGDGGVLIQLREKPEHSFFVNAGMYLLEPDALKYVGEGEFLHLTELIARIQEDGRRVGVFPVSEGSWTDVGEWHVYKQALSRRGIGGW